MYLKYLCVLPKYRTKLYFILFFHPKKPNGLDIEMLLGTGTSLIAGLLGGDENFGKVLGGYVGTALDGLSGGGGAVSPSTPFNFN